MAHVSWNGATEVVRWQVLAGRDPQHLQPIASRSKTGFETTIRFSTQAAVVQIRALNARGAVLGSSRPLRP